MRQLSPSRETTHRYMRETNKTQENKNWTGKNLLKKGEEKKKRQAQFLPTTTAKEEAY